MERTVSGLGIRKLTKREQQDLGNRRHGQRIRVILNRAKVKVLMTHNKITLRYLHLIAAQLS